MSWIAEDDGVLPSILSFLACEGLGHGVREAEIVSDS